MAKKFGFETWAFLVIGAPGEDRKKLQETLDFVKELDPDFAKFHILRPFPGSELFRQLKSQGLIFDFNYSNYNVYSPPVHSLPSLSAEEIKQFHKKAFRDFYFRPKKMAQHIARIKTPTQLFLNAKSAIYILKQMFLS
ncbi:MAG: hypothetical protein V1493_04380 [Candidatus Diapherotrites archaeon]